MTETEQSHAAPGAAPGGSPERLARRGDGRMIAGVAAGIADHFGVAPVVVRLAFVVLAAAGGTGVALYLAAWVLMPLDERAAAGAGPGPGRSVDPDWATLAALGAIVLGLLLLTVQIGGRLWGRFVVPVTFVSVGLALLWIWPRAQEGTAPSVPEALVRRMPTSTADAVAALVGTRRGSLVRLLAGAVLVVLGVGALFATTETFAAARRGLFATLVTAAGLALIFGPWLWRLATELGEERRERIRSQERAEMAAHLHDSVLQTLALVQRRAGDSREVVRLARRQERELRAWLLGGPDGAPRRGANGAHDVDGYQGAAGDRGADDPDGTGGTGDSPAAAPQSIPSSMPSHASLGAALEAVAAEVEEEHGVPVEVVRVRDCPIDGAAGALLAAAREAIVNACRHSGAPTVSVYLEVGDREATVFVRDRGCGYDPEAVAPDRRGVAESINGRMARHGGRSSVRTAPGEGTEVELTMRRGAS